MSNPSAPGLARSGLAAVVVVALVASLHSTASPVAPPAPIDGSDRSPSAGDDVRALHAQGDIGVIVGAGGNITVQASDARAAGPGAGEGLLLVDSALDSEGRPRASREQLAKRHIFHEPTEDLLQRRRA